ncbi:MAG: TRAP transporter substrate-binding protein [Candidatus Dadabacteria bacterium]|nr:MAG: TRAP transporter substrate-binding protein [Candidatus Dadabacteria bacterium]
MNKDNSRRRFIKTFLLGTAAGASYLLGVKRRAFAIAKRKRWRMALAVPKTLPLWGEGAERFAKNVEQLTSGSIKIKIYGARELVPAFGTFEAVQKGQIQLGHSAAYYWQGKIPAAVFFSSVPFGMDTKTLLSWLEAGGGQELYDKLMAPFGVKCFVCGATGYQMTGWFNKKIEKPEDLKGLKIRIPGLAAKVYALAGAQPVLMAGGEVFTALSTGVIDAVEWVGPYQDYLMGLHKGAKYYYGASWHEPGTVLELMINKKLFEGLSKEEKLILETVCRDTTLWMKAHWEAKNAEYLQKIKKEGKVKVLPLPVEVLRVLREKAEKVKKDVAGTSKIAKEIYTSYTTFQKKYEEYQKLSESNYYKVLGRC